ncbi:aldehyde dehydrogenase [Bradyrhizobium sp. 2TAF24]|uniref:aldehyde dehydrogenase n=1 Tax=Bradyrhizobium sp. 2TAF24 TaxID=3233011 RepID=UPI003F910EF7
MNPRPNFVGGRPVAGTGPLFASIDPATGRRNGEFTSANAADVDAAVRIAAEAAGQTAWRTMRPHERARILSRIADGMAACAEDLAAIQMQENGKVIAECRAQVASAIATYRYYAAVCETTESELTPPRGDYLSMTVHEPIGVVAAITPWNSPLTMEAQKVAPALAAGNAVVLKPSEVTPTAALDIAAIAVAAGLPPGLLNVLTGTGADTGAALVTHPSVGMVSFTGGTETGRAIARLCADRLIPSALELGGKSPNIVFADAGLDAAVDGVAGGIFEGSGQSCVAGSRLFVQRAIYDPFLDKLRARTEALRVGLPAQAGTTMGPLASFPHRERVERFVQSARDEGGAIVSGGRRPDDDALTAGAFYLPTIIAGLNNAATVCRQEIFGPVLCVLPFDDEDDVIAQANDSVYGLACGVWTGDYRKAWRVARAVQAGTVWINTYKQLSIAAPFGGFKHSGLGREKGIQGMRLYQQSKSIYFGLADATGAA